MHLSWTSQAVRTHWKIEKMFDVVKIIVNQWASTIFFVSLVKEQVQEHLRLLSMKRYSSAYYNNRLSIQVFHCVIIVINIKHFLLSYTDFSIRALVKIETGQVQFIPTSLKFKYTDRIFVLLRQECGLSNFSNLPLIQVHVYLPMMIAGFYGALTSNTFALMSGWSRGALT